MGGYKTIMSNDHQILGANTFDFDKTAIIRPPFEQLKNTPLKYTRVVIDSRDRDLQNYPNANKYSIFFDNEIEDVVSGEVVLLQIPFANYNIDKYNNTFVVSGQNVVIEKGQYSVDDLIIELNTKLSAFNISVTYVKTQDKLQFRGISSFTLEFKNHLNKVFGFTNTTYVCDSSTFVLLPENRVNLNIENFIVLHIDGMTINVSSNNVINKSTYIVSRCDTLLNTKAHLVPIKKYFNPIISRLTRINIRFTDYYGNPYDFQNQDHRIEFHFESKKQLMRYSSYV